MKAPEALRRTAARLRELADRAPDCATPNELLDMAVEYDRLARLIEATIEAWAVPPARCYPGTFGCAGRCASSPCASVVAMSERGDHLRAKAAELRALAEIAPSPEIAWDLRGLAIRYERLADHADLWPRAPQPEVNGITTS